MSKVSTRLILVLALGANSFPQSPPPSNAHQAQKQSQACSLAASVDGSTVGQDQLLRTYNQQVERLHSIVILGDFIARAKKEPGADEGREISGTLLAERPGWIRIIGKPPLLGRRIFDMASDGREVHLQVPNPMRFYIEPADLEPQPNLALTSIRPQDLLNAALWRPISEKTAVQIRSQGSAGERALEAREGDSVRSIHFDKSGGLVTLIELSVEGSPVSVFRYAEWAASGENGEYCFPRHISIERTQERYQVEVLVNRVGINRELPLASFRLEPPPGIQVIRLGTEPGTKSANAARIH